MPNKNPAMPSITKYVIAKPLALAVLDVHLQQHIVLSNWQTLGNTIITHKQSLELSQDSPSSAELRWTLERPKRSNICWKFLTAITFAIRLMHKNKKIEMLDKEEGPCFEPIRKC